MMREKFYRLGQHYKIIEKADGGLWWESHMSLAGAQTGRCMVKGPVLILGAPETESPGFLKKEWQQNLTKLPAWERTTYFCHSHALYVCETGTRLKSGVSGSMEVESFSGAAPLPGVGPSKPDPGGSLKPNEPIPVG